MYQLNKNQMVIENTEKNEITCLVNTKRPDLFETKVNELLDKANNYEKAVELLKEFAFYNVDDNVKEHCEKSVKVQNFLRNTYAKEWLYNALKESGDKELEWKGDMTEWGEIYCPFVGRDLMTYYPTGTPPYDSVTNPFVDDEGNIYYYKYDHDEGGWCEDTFGLWDAGEYENIEDALFY